MNRDETNEVSGVTDDQLGRTAEPYESGNWRGGVGSIIRSNPKSGTDTSRTQQTRIIRVHRLSDVFRNRESKIQRKRQPHRTGPRIGPIQGRAIALPPS